MKSQRSFFKKNKTKMYNHRNVDHSGISDAQKSSNFTATQIATVL